MGRGLSSPAFDLPFARFGSVDVRGGGGEARAAGRCCHRCCGAGGGAGQVLRAGREMRGPVPISDRGEAPVTLLYCPSFSQHITYQQPYMCVCQNAISRLVLLCCYVAMLCTLLCCYLLFIITITITQLSSGVRASPRTVRLKVVDSGFFLGGCVQGTCRVPHGIGRDGQG